MEFFLMNKILLIEDDIRLAELMKSYFSEYGFHVHVEYSGENLVALVSKQNFDVLILDINLPGKNGLALCKDVRPIFDGALLILTARDSNADQLLGFEFGADDYAIKPVDPSVLLARVKALLRRSNSVKINDTLLQFGRLSVDCKNREVHFNNTLVDLSSHEFDLLQIFSSKVGEILSREYLFNVIFSRPYDGLDRSIDVRVSHLRKKLSLALDGTPNSEAGIKTVWGKGYLFQRDTWA